jgi:hypothetical protein
VADRDERIISLLLLRERLEEGYCVMPEDWFVIIDTLRFVLGDPTLAATAATEGPGPWDEFDHQQEREAIEREPVSVYYLLRHPRI